MHPRAGSELLFFAASAARHQTQSREKQITDIVIAQEPKQNTTNPRKQNERRQSPQPGLESLGKSDQQARAINHVRGAASQLKKCPKRMSSCRKRNRPTGEPPVTVTTKTSLQAVIIRAGTALYFDAFKESLLILSTDATREAPSAPSPKKLSVLDAKNEPFKNLLALPV